MNKIMTGLVAFALLVSFMIPASAFATSPIATDYKRTVHVVSPNGGEAYELGSKTKIKWESVITNHSNKKVRSKDKVDIYLVSDKDSKNTQHLVASNIKANKGEYKWKAGQIITTDSREKKHATVDADTYKIKVCIKNTNTCDTSDSEFKIYKNGETKPVPTTRLEGDINYDGIVNVTDLLAVIQSWGSCPVVTVADNVRIKNPCPADVNSDQKVNQHDLDIVVANWHR